MYTTSLRTQIILPKELRDAIEKQRITTGESLAEYLRTAARERLQRERKRKKDLKKLADEFMEFAEKNSKDQKKQKKADLWVEQIRRDRAEEDTHIMKRLDEAWKSTSRSSK